MRVSVKGRLVPPDEVEYPKGAIGWLRGFGVYETLCHYPGGFFSVDLHLDRLEGSTGLLRIPMPDRQELKAALVAYAAAEELEWARTRVVVLEGGTEGPGKPGAPWWMIEGVRSPGPRPPVEERALSLWVSTLCIPPPPLGAAKTISRVSYELAAVEAQEHGADDAIMPTVQGELAELTRASLFWREGPVVHTPPLELGILPGVTRLLVMRHLPEAGYEVRETTAPVDRLWEADEVFVTSTVRGIAPAVRILTEGRPPRELPVGEATRAADETFRGLVRAAGLRDR